MYLQGRYEVQLADSWGVQRPTYADIGGIYQRWDEARPQEQRGFEGHPPRINAARAPGLWQHLRIRFRAPRFDADGRKVSNARLLEVQLNGSTVQTDVELTGPTRLAPFEDESPLGPLMLQANAGSAAFRNIQFKRYDADAPALEAVRYTVYEGTFRSLADVATAEPVRSGTAERLNLDVVQRRDDFAVRFDAVFPAPVSGEYQFALLCEGGCLLEIDDTLRVGPEEDTAGWLLESDRMQLEAGNHPVRITYYKSHRWWRPSLSLYVEGPGFEPSPLHEVVPGRMRSVNPIYVHVDGEPRLLRSFLNHGGEKLTHAISVGSPAGTHFSYDLSSGSLLQVWHGDFLDVTEMWHERGEPQVAVPRGSTISFPRAPLLVQGDVTGPGADPVPLQYEGFTVDASGFPSFTFRSDNLEINDFLSPGEHAADLVRTIAARGTGGAPGTWIRLAAADEIRPIGDATYAIADFSYFIVLPDAASDAVVVGHRNGLQELMVPLPASDSEVSYILRW